MVSMCSDQSVPISKDLVRNETWSGRRGSEREDFTRNSPCMSLNTVALGSPTSSSPAGAPESDMTPEAGVMRCGAKIESEGGW